MEYSKFNKIMKKALPILIGLLAISCIFVAFKKSEQQESDDNQRKKIIMQAVEYVFENGHYSNVTFNDELSVKMFKAYIEHLDYAKRFLLQSDYEELKKDEKNLDDYFKTGDLNFFNHSVEIILKRQEQAKRYYEQAIQSKFDYTSNEEIETDHKKAEYVSDTLEMQKNWYKITKLAIIEKLDNLLEIQEKAIANNDTSYKVKTFEQLDSIAIAQVKDNYDDWMRRISKINQNDYFSYYVNSIAEALDPHSEYLPPQEKNNFDISMSGKFEGIGATLQSKNGQTKVVDIIPGSASWRQGELEINDVILKVAQDTAQAVDITNMDLDDAVQLIRGKKGTIVRLTVKKVNGNIKVIPIERDVVIIEETYAKSSVLEMNNKRVGYIHLPKFYADFNDNNGRFCSKDVKKEIEKLSSENVSGIIIDLRFNGGGSLSDVVDMGGLFINNGPIVQVKTREGKIDQLKDNKNGTSWNGPLVIMVNSLSASASEILAAALQDYNRAIIIGENTFGKGTVQRVLDIDQLINGFNDIKPFGALKLTVQKFYRINGGTTQLLGVKPDIILPDVYTFLENGEREYPNALENDFIAKANYKECELGFNKKKVIKNAQQRISQSKEFNLIIQNAKRLKELKDDSKYSLNLEAYRNHQKEIKSKAEEFENIGKEKTGLTASFIKLDKNTMNNDSIKIKKFTKWFEEIEKDIYIHQAFSIINDMN